MFHGMALDIQRDKFILTAVLNFSLGEQAVWL